MVQACVLVCEKEKVLVSEEREEWGIWGIRCVMLGCLGLVGCCLRYRKGSTSSVGYSLLVF